MVGKGRRTGKPAPSKVWNGETTRATERPAAGAVCTGVVVMGRLNYTIQFSVKTEQFS